MKNPFSFKGECGRKPFWIAFSIILILMVALLFFFELMTPYLRQQLHWHISDITLLLFGSYLLLGLFCFPLCVRRIHDAGYSGFCIFIPVYHFYLWCLPSAEKKCPDPSHSTAKIVGIVFLIASCLFLIGHSVFSVSRAQSTMRDYKQQLQSTLPSEHAQAVQISTPDSTSDSYSNDSTK